MILQNMIESKTDGGMFSGFMSSKASLNFLGLSYSRPFITTNNTFYDEVFTTNNIKPRVHVTRASYFIF